MYLTAGSSEERQKYSKTKRIKLTPLKGEYSQWKSSRSRKPGVRLYSRRKVLRTQSIWFLEHKITECKTQPLFFVPMFMFSMRLRSQTNFRVLVLQPSEHRKSETCCTIYCTRTARRLVGTTLSKRRWPRRQPSTSSIVRKTNSGPCESRTSESCWDRRRGLNWKKDRRGRY